MKADTAAPDAIGRAAARELLARNATPHGLLAATPLPAARSRGYHGVFARDAAICALGIALDGEPALLRAAAASLRTLAQHQAENGQIPKFVNVEQNDSDFWYLGCIDASLWWLIALDVLRRAAPPEMASELEALRPHAERALAWLRCQEHPRLHLLQQNEASDWADIMPRSGFVLYTNALWYEVKRRYAPAEAQATHYHFNHLFYPFTRQPPEYRRLRLLTHYVRRRALARELYLSFVNFSYWGEEGDVLGNLLAIVFGLADPAHALAIVRALERAGVHEPHPVRAVVTPIRREDLLWRTYMGRHRQNLEYQYHNGGSWPFIGGFWVSALVRVGQHERARQELARLTQMNALRDWEFNEWFHGASGAPRGMAGQSWSAAMLLLAQHAVERRISDIFPVS